MNTNTASESSSSTTHPTYHSPHPTHHHINNIHSHNLSHNQPNKQMSNPMLSYTTLQYISSNNNHHNNNQHYWSGQAHQSPPIPSYRHITLLSSNSYDSLCLPPSSYTLNNNNILNCRYIWPTIWLDTAKSTSKAPNRSSILTHSSIWLPTHSYAMAWFS